MKRLLGVVLGVVLLVVALAGPASARADETATFVCVDTATGEVTFVLVVAADATFGQSRANEVYNAVNPFGSFCSIQ